MSTASWVSKALLPWYHIHKRDLPWRNTRDPYRIWLSEVILQQTRVEQGTAYYHRFLATFPDVASLADASETEVLKLWQGLGYYSRGRNLLAAARQVVHEHAAKFPQEANDLLKLKGVGQYTAAAIASIAFGRKQAVVDGNVQRVLTRLFGIHTPVDSIAGQREVQALADRLIDQDNPGDHNQAMMELGATVCLPRNPACDRCPLQQHCRARSEGLQGQFPVKSKRKEPRRRYFQFIEVDHEGYTLLQERTGKDIWRGLYHYPLLETEGPADEGELLATLSRSTRTKPGAWRITHRSEPVMHLLTHQKLEAVFWRVLPPARFHMPEGWFRVPLGELERWPMPRVMERHREAGTGKRG